MAHLMRHESAQSPRFGCTDIKIDPCCSQDAVLIHDHRIEKCIVMFVLLVDFSSPHCEAVATANRSVVLSCINEFHTGTSFGSGCCPGPHHLEQRFALFGAEHITNEKHFYFGVDWPMVVTHRSEERR